MYVSRIFDVYNYVVLIFIDEFLFSAHKDIYNFYIEIFLKNIQKDFVKIIFWKKCKNSRLKI